MAYRESLVRHAIQGAAEQNLVDFATEARLEALGRLVGVSSPGIAWEDCEGATGGGVLTYTKLIDETFSNLTNWTQVGGTWSVASNIATQASTAAAYSYLRFNTPTLSLTYGAVFQIDINLPATPSADARVGWAVTNSSSAASNALGLILHYLSGASKIAAYNIGVSTYFDIAATYGVNTWVTLRVERRLGTYKYFINGVLVTTQTFFSVSQDPESNYINIYTYNSSAQFRNAQFWVVKEPALP